MSKKGTVMKCENCFKWDHNQRTCKAPDNPNKKAYKKKKKGQLGQSPMSGAKVSKKLLVKFQVLLCWTFPAFLALYRVLSNQI